MIKRRMLKELEMELAWRSKIDGSLQDDFLLASRLQNYFKHWKKAARINQKKQKIRKATLIYKRINDNVYYLKMEAYVKWIMAARRIRQKELDD